DEGQQADLLELAGESASAGAHHEAAARYLRRALGHYRVLGDRVGIVRTTAALAQGLLTTRQNDEALSMLVPAMSELADVAPHPSFVALQAQLARAYMLREDNTRAVEVVEPVLAVAEHAELEA